MAAPGEPTLSLRAVCVRGGRHLLLDRVSLDLWPGELGMLIGPNGAGKSTLVRAALDLLPVESGSIRIMGMDWRDPAARRHTGYVPQSFLLERTIPLTCREFLADYAAARSLLPGSGDMGRQAQRLIAERLGLAAKLDRPLGVLSGGEVQRLLIAAAFLGDPDLILLDEPLAGIDMQGEGDFHGIVDSYRADHPRAAFLIVSHDIGVVYRKATRVFCLNRTIHAEGPPSEALTHETFEKLYGMAHFPGAHHHHVH